MELSTKSGDKEQSNENSECMGSTLETKLKFGTPMSGEKIGCVPASQLQEQVFVKSCKVH